MYSKWNWTYPVSLDVPTTTTNGENKSLLNGMNNNNINMSDFEHCKMTILSPKYFENTCQFILRSQLHIYMNEFSRAHKIMLKY